MDFNHTNPLSSHFRKPAIYFKLPSRGQYWPEDALEMPINGELPVFPMTNADEITLKTPDALMNGQGIVDVIQSCCPNIKNAWHMPSVDVDATLIAIRLASYGQSMDIGATCPKCGEVHDYTIDLTGLTDIIRCPDYQQPVEYDGLRINLRPQQYISITQTNIVQFEEQKILQTLNNSEISEELRNARLAESMKTLLDLNTQALVNSTDSIEMEDGTKVANPEYISEFYKNTSGKVAKQVETHLAALAAQAAIPPTDITCGSCGNKFSVPLEFDYSRFFA